MTNEKSLHMCLYLWIIYVTVDVLLLFCLISCTCVRPVTILTMCVSFVSVHFTLVRACGLKSDSIKTWKLEHYCPSSNEHYSDVIMGAMAYQTTGVSIVNLTVCSGVDQRKYQSSASLAFVRGIHRSPVYARHEGPVTWNMIPLDDVIAEVSVTASCESNMKDLISTQQPNNNAVIYLFDEIHHMCRVQLLM